MQGEPEWCEEHPAYQSPARTAVETLLCVLVFASYVPQYLSILAHGTRAISSRFVLFHSLSSTMTLALRLCHPVFYSAFNCVDGGPYTRWKAYSALLGVVQAVVQFLASIILLTLYAVHRTPPTADDPVECPEPGVPSTVIKTTVGTVAVTVIPVSLAFLWCNQLPYFDQDDPGTLGRYTAVYIVGLGLWMCLLVPANLAAVVLQFVYQLRTAHALHSQGALSLVSLLMQAIALVSLAVAQTFRSRSGIMWVGPPWHSIQRFLEMWVAFVGTINTQLAYLLVGLGFLALFIAVFLDRRSTGRITL